MTSANANSRAPGLVIAPFSASGFLLGLFLSFLPQAPDRSFLGPAKAKGSAVQGAALFHVQLLFPKRLWPSGQQTDGWRHQPNLPKTDGHARVFRSKEGGGGTEKRGACVCVIVCSRRSAFQGAETSWTPAASTPTTRRKRYERQPSTSKRKARTSDLVATRCN